MKEQFITCNWLGKPVIEDSSIAPCFSLIIHPISDLSDTVCQELSRFSELTRMDIRIRLQPQAWFFLMRSVDHNDLTRAATGLSAGNINTTIFEDTKAYPVPQPVTALTARIEPNRLILLNAVREPVLIVDQGSRLLIVTALISFSSHEEKCTVGYHAYQDAVIPVGTHGSYRIEEKRAVTDIYDLEQGVCARIAEPNFNFREAGFNDVVSFREGHRALLAALREHTHGVVIDTRFKRSSLPYTIDTGSKSHATPYREGFGTIHRGKSTSDTSQRFEQYSRFMWVLHNKI